LLLLAVIFEGTQVIAEYPIQFYANGHVFLYVFQAYPTTLLGLLFWNKMIKMKSLHFQCGAIDITVAVFGILGGYCFMMKQLPRSQIIAALLIFIRFCLWGKWHCRN